MGLAKGFSAATILFNLVVVQSVLTPCLSQNFDFYYFVQQWLGSYCDTKRSCCYPKTGKPEEDFGIHGLWPNNNTGKYPQNCHPENALNKTQVLDLIERMQIDWPTLTCPSADGIKFWGHEWTKHGTCTSLDQHSYFKTALDLKHKANLLQHLTDAGIRPGAFYSLESIKQAINNGVGYEADIECNTDLAGNQQLYQVYVCVDAPASNFINCPMTPRQKRCNSTIEFPSFSSASQLRDSL